VISYFEECPLAIAETILDIARVRLARRHAGSRPTPIAASAQDTQKRKPGRPRKANGSADAPSISA